MYSRLLFRWQEQTFLPTEFQTIFSPHRPRLCTLWLHRLTPDRPNSPRCKLVACRYVTLCVSDDDVAALWSRLLDRCAHPAAAASEDAATAVCSIRCLLCHVCLVRRLSDACLMQHIVPGARGYKSGVWSNRSSQVIDSVLSALFLARDTHTCFCPCHTGGSVKNGRASARFYC